MTPKGREGYIPFSLKYSRINIWQFGVIFGQKQISWIKFSWSSVSPVECMHMYTTSTNFFVE